MFQILHFSDCHLFADPTGKLNTVCTADTLAAVLAAAERQASRSKMAIITGDLAQDGEAEAYRLAERMFASLTIPVYAIPGNHDLADVMEKSLLGQPIAWKRSVVVEGWHMVFLNSAHPDRLDGWLSEQEFVALEAALTARPGMPTLISLHHQPVVVETPWQDQMGLVGSEHFFKLLERYPWTRAVLFGHIHRPDEESWGGVRLLAAPSTCAQFAKGTEQPVWIMNSLGYRWLRLYPDGGLETGITWV